MSTPVFVDPEISTQADRAQSSRVPVPLPKDPYEAIRQAYLDGTDTEFEPFENPVETETPKSPLTVASPTSLLEGTPPTLVPIIRRTIRMAVRVPPAMSSGLFASIAEVAAMSESVFCKRFRSSYESLPSSTAPTRPSSRKRYWDCGLDDEGHNIESDGLAAGDEGLVAGDEGLGMGVESRGLDDESRGLDDEGHNVESDGLGLREEEEVVPDGQQRAVPVVRTADGMVYIDVPAYPPPAPHVQTPPSLEWSSGSLPISPTPSIVPSPISSPMIPLTVPSPVATPATAKPEEFLTELGAQVEMQGGLIHDHAVRLEELSPALFERYDRDIRELFTRSGA
ncbi:hypothetical protein Tco_1552088, partial [Tanacetum coccineum]